MISKLASILDEAEFSLRSSMHSLTACYGWIFGQNLTQADYSSSLLSLNHAEPLLVLRKCLVIRPIQTNENYTILEGSQTSDVGKICPSVPTVALSFKYLTIVYL